MLAVDTNILVRFLTRDDPDQFARASALIGKDDLYLCTTVLLEAEWVLRRAYGFSSDRVVAALRAFAGLPRLTLEDAALAGTALEWAAAGMDFADALHLARAEKCEAFVSFDRKLARAARKLGGVRVREP